MNLSPEAQAADHARAAAFYQQHIDHIEAQLDATDPQRVVACSVPGYVDPPERVAAAEAERAAGVVHFGPMTVEAVRSFEAGKLKRPDKMTGLSNAEIHDAKAQAVHYRKALGIAAAIQSQP